MDTLKTGNRTAKMKDRQHSTVSENVPIEFVAKTKSHSTIAAQLHFIFIASNHNKE